MKSDELERMVTDLYEKSTPPDIIKDIINNSDPNNNYDVIGENITENEVYKNEVKDIINEALNDMPEFDRQVLILRFGLNGNDRHTRPEIVKILNSTIDIVRNAEDRAVRRLKHPKYTKRLRDYIDIDNIDTKVIK